MKTKRRKRSLVRESLLFEDDEGNETIEIGCELSQQDCLLYLALVILFSQFLIGFDF